MWAGRDVHDEDGGLSGMLRGRHGLTTMASRAVGWRAVVVVEEEGCFPSLGIHPRQSEQAEMGLLLQLQNRVH